MSLITTAISWLTTLAIWGAIVYLAFTIGKILITNLKKKKQEMESRESGKPGKKEPVKKEEPVKQEEDVAEIRKKQTIIMTEIINLTEDYKKKLAYCPPGTPQSVKTHWAGSISALEELKDAMIKKYGL